MTSKFHKETSNGVSWSLWCSWQCL